MEVVSEKTGYPIETLEPAMDMESDLGIDSIKRVEILGAMQTSYPDLPKLKPEELAELRTLGQIVEHIGGKLGASNITPAVTAPVPVAVAPVAPKPIVQTPAPVAVVASGVDLAELTQTLWKWSARRLVILLKHLNLPWTWNLTSALTRSSAWKSSAPCRPVIPTCQNSNRKNSLNCVLSVRSLSISAENLARRLLLCLRQLLQQLRLLHLRLLQW